MQIRNVIVIIGGKEEMDEHVLAATEAEAGNHYLYLPPEFAPKFLSTQRLRLLKAIKEHPSYGTVKLAHLLRRKQEAISRDIGMLRGAGIIVDGESKKTKIEATIPNLRKIEASPLGLTIVF